MGKKVRVEDLFLLTVWNPYFHVFGLHILHKKVNCSFRCMTGLFNLIVFGTVVEIDLVIRFKLVQ